MLVKNAPFIFNNDFSNAFNRLKEALVSAPIISPSDWALHFEIICNASDHSMGRCLVRGKKTSFMLYTMQVELLQRPS